MNASEKSYQNLSYYNQFLFNKRFEVNKKKLSSEKWEIQVIVFMIMLTGSSERIFNSMRYTVINFFKCCIHGTLNQFLMLKVFVIMTKRKNNFRKHLERFFSLWYLKNAHDICFPLTYNRNSYPKGILLSLLIPYSRKSRAGIDYLTIPIEMVG